MLDVTQLRGISRTASYFHNNSAATLEDVLDHYEALFRRAARLNPPPNLPPILSSNGLVIDRGFLNVEERAALLAYLRKLETLPKGLANQGAVFQDSQGCSFHRAFTLRLARVLS
jgi:cytochrome c peroxidase